jgi:hypothetical protein
VQDHINCAVEDLGDVDAVKLIDRAAQLRAAQAA